MNELKYFGVFCQLFYFALKCLRIIYTCMFLVSFNSLFKNEYKHDSNTGFYFNPIRL